MQEMVWVGHLTSSESFNNMVTEHFGNDQPLRVMVNKCPLTLSHIVQHLLMCLQEYADSENPIKKPYKKENQSLHILKCCFLGNQHTEHKLCVCFRQEKVQSFKRGTGMIGSERWNLFVVKTAACDC